MRRHKGQFIMYNMEDGRAERTPQGAAGGRGVTEKTSKMHHPLFLLTLWRPSERYTLCPSDCFFCLYIQHKLVQLWLRRLTGSSDDRRVGGANSAPPLACRRVLGQDT